MKKKRKKVPVQRRWNREINRTTWPYRVMVSPAVEAKVAIDEFEKVMDSAMAGFVDDDFVDYDNRKNVPPDKQVKVTIYDMNGDYKTLMMLLPLIVDGKRTLYCQLTTDAKEEIVLDIQYPIQMGNQRVEPRKR